MPREALRESKKIVFDKRFKYRAKNIKLYRIVFRCMKFLKIKNYFYVKFLITS